MRRPSAQPSAHGRGRAPARAVGSTGVSAAVSAAEAAALAVLLGVTACSSPTPGTASAPVDAAGAEFDAARRADSLLASPLGPEVAAGVMDGPAEMGIGIAYLVHQLVEAARSDTVLIRSAPAATAPVVARYILDVRSGGSWTWRLESLATTDEALELNSLEFAYEESGLPLDSLVVVGDAAEGAAAEWARVIYAREVADTAPGSTAAGPITAGTGGIRRIEDTMLRRGWVRLAPGRMERILFHEHLPQQTLFLLTPVHARFFDSPGGDEVDAGIASSDADHIMYPLRRHGRWLQVEVVTPSDYCWDPLPQTRRTVAWIPYLDDGGRARVWYYSRGC